MQNKLISVIMAICLLCSMYYLARTAVIYTMQQEKRGEQPVIVLDAGHGGEDPGKIGINGALEKDVNLQITMRLARLLQQNGYHVILTRNEDKGLYTGNQGSKKVEDLKTGSHSLNRPVQHWRSASTRTAIRRKVCVAHRFLL